MRYFLAGVLVTALAIVSACAVGPNYRRPEFDAAVSYKEQDGLPGNRLQAPLRHGNAGPRSQRASAVGAHHVVNMHSKKTSRYRPRWWNELLPHTARASTRQAENYKQQRALYMDWLH